MAIPVTLSHSVVRADGVGVIGTFNTDGLTFSVNGNPNGFFQIVGRLLVARWIGQAIPGQYTIQVHAPGGTPYSFQVTITPTAYPVAITLTPPAVSLQDNALSGAAVCSFAVQMSDGSQFGGPLTITPSGMLAAAGGNITLGRDLSTADDGMHAMIIMATQNVLSASATLALTVAAQTMPPVITVTPNQPQIPDTASLNSVVATYMVTMSDGSPFTGTVAFGAPNFDNGGVFALVAASPSSGQIIVNPAGPGVGPNLGTITDHVTLVATT